MDKLEIVLFMVVFFMVLFCVAILIDRVTSIDESGNLPVVENELVPCVDNFGRHFENEMCKITCSKLGLVGDRKCRK